MQKLICAKCGANVRRLTTHTKLSSRSFPIFMISKYEYSDVPPIRIDLCKKCSEKLDEWLSDSDDSGKDTYTV